VRVWGRVEGGAHKFTTRSSVHVGLCGATSVLVRGQGEKRVSAPVTPNSIKFLRSYGENAEAADET
jgi:hypothetical protein